MKPGTLKRQNVYHRFSIEDPSRLTLEKRGDKAALLTAYPTETSEKSIAVLISNLRAIETINEAGCVHPPCSAAGSKNASITVCSNIRLK